MRRRHTYSTKELAKVFNVHERTIRKWFESNKLLGYKSFFGNSWKINRRDLLYFINGKYPYNSDKREQILINLLEIDEEKL